MSKNSISVKRNNLKLKDEPLIDSNPANNSWYYANLLSKLDYQNDQLEDIEENIKSNKAVDSLDFNSWISIIQSDELYNEQNYCKLFLGELQFNNKKEENNYFLSDIARMMALKFAESYAQIILLDKISQVYRLKMNLPKNNINKQLKKFLKTKFG